MRMDVINCTHQLMVECVQMKYYCNTYTNLGSDLML